MTTRSVTTTLSLVDALAEAGSMGLSELARQQEVSKATALRLLKTLEELGWAAQGPAPSRAWSLTDHIVWLARNIATDTTLREIALESMSRLQLQTKETVHLAAKQPDHLVLIERLDSPHELRAFFSLGTVLPFHASATGLAYLAALPDEKVESLLEGALQAKTKHTLTDPESVWHEIKAVRERGFSLNSSGLVNGIASVGAPLIGSGGEPVGAVSVSGPASRVTAERRREVGPLVAEAAQEISRRLQR